MFKAEGRTAAAMVVLSMVLFSLGCGTESPTNSNQNTAGNRNPAVAQNQTTTTVTPSAACSELDPKKRAADVKTELGNKLGVGSTGNDLKIEVLVASNKNYLELLIEGSTKGKAKFEDQMKLISEEYMTNGCIMTVYFVPDGTVQTPGSSLTDDFEWGYCEAPQYPCPDGTCSQNQQCPLATGMPTNTTGNSANNSNTTTNNGNSNR